MMRARCMRWDGGGAAPWLGNTVWRPACGLRELCEKQNNKANAGEGASHTDEKRNGATGICAGSRVTALPRRRRRTTSLALSSGPRRTMRTHSVGRCRGQSGCTRASRTQPRKWRFKCYQANCLIRRSGGGRRSIGWAMAKHAGSRSAGPAHAIGAKRRSVVPHALNPNSGPRPRADLISWPHVLGTTPKAMRQGQTAALIHARTPPHTIRAGRVTRLHTRIVTTQRLR